MMDAIMKNTNQVASGNITPVRSNYKYDNTTTTSNINSQPQQQQYDVGSNNIFKQRRGTNTNGKVTGREEPQQQQQKIKPAIVPARY